MKPSLVVAGLGNPGKQYESTRHNLGFRGVDLLAEHMGEGQWVSRQKFLALVWEGHGEDTPVLFVKPQTFMNRSGESLKKIVDFYHLDPKSQVLVLCDDIDLPPGTVRLRMSGGPGTHNGLKSVVEHFGEDFPRLRIGLGAQPPGADLASWVLSAPTADESKVIGSALQEQLPPLLKKYVGMLANSESRS